MRRSAPPSLALSLFFSLAPACGDDGSGTSGLSAGSTTSATSNPGTTTTGSTTAPGSTGTTEPATTDASTSTGDTTSPTTSSGNATATGSSTATGTTMDPNCPPVKGEYNDCTDENGKTDNKLCNWMGDGENGFITCLNAAGMMGASTCSLVNCELDCHCFNQPATGTAKSICKANATDKGDNACILDCSNGATCPDGMVCDNDTCFWPAP